jgi:tRNA(His) guanylyltransferase
MEDMHDIVIAFGQSDEYSFVIKKSSNVFTRRVRCVRERHSLCAREDALLFCSKIMTAVVSCFTSNYVFHWPSFMKNEDGSVGVLAYPPQFDGRVVCYPTLKNLRDYLAWRQADCMRCICGVEMAGHINNLYNTLFWALVLKGNISETEAEAKIRVSALTLR